MAWIIFIVLMLFYFLGLKAFHAGGPVHLLPFAAVAVLVIDQLLRWRARRS